MLSISTKIQPLVEDLGNILSGDFLKSTEYKRWLVEYGMDEVWSQCLDYVQRNRSYVMLGYDHDAADAQETLGYVVNLFFEQRKESLPQFLKDILSFYTEEKSVYINVNDIVKDLLAAGYTKEEVAILDSIPIPKMVEEKVKEEQTQEQKIRNLEKKYISMVEANSDSAINIYLEWHSSALLYLSNYYTEANADYCAFKQLDNSGNGFSLYRNFNSIYSRYNLLMNNVTKQGITKAVVKAKKTPFLFISHSTSDKEFANALVNLLEDIGFTNTTMFCSSVREYGIPLSGDIFETIRALFLEHDLYVIFIHSPRFYGSAVSLNEMGAAWVLKTDFCSFLTNDMDFGKMKGVVNNAKLSIKVDDTEATALLNELYKHLTVLFSFEQMDMNKWERKRDQFLTIVRTLKYSPIEDNVEENKVDIEYKKLQIDKMKAEAENSRKAIIRGNIIKDYRGGIRTLKIFNVGAATARNLRVEWINEDDNIIFTSDFSEIGNLTPQNSRSYDFHLAIGHTETMNLRYYWEDDFANDNHLEEWLQL